MLPPIPRNDFRPGKIPARPASPPAPPAPPPPVGKVGAVPPGPIPGMPKPPPVKIGAMPARAPAVPSAPPPPPATGTRTPLNSCMSRRATWPFGHVLDLPSQLREVYILHELNHP